MALLSKIQSRQNKIEAANDTFNQDFIINGYPSIKITSEDSKTKLTAAIHNKQESDEAYFYTVKSKPLTIGSV